METLDLFMTDTPSTMVKEGSTFHYNLSTVHWWENTVKYHEFARKVKLKRRNYLKKKCIKSRELYGKPLDAVDLMSNEEAEVPAVSNVHMIEGEAEERPGYVYDRLLGTCIKAHKS